MGGRTQRWRENTHPPARRLLQNALPAAWRDEYNLHHDGSANACELRGGRGISLSRTEQPSRQAPSRSGGRCQHVHSNDTLPGAAVRPSAQHLRAREASQHASRDSLPVPACGRAGGCEHSLSRQNLALLRRARGAPINASALSNESVEKTRRGETLRRINPLGALSAHFLRCTSACTISPS